MRYIFHILCALNEDGNSQMKTLRTLLQPFAWSCCTLPRATFCVSTCNEQPYLRLGLRIYRVPFVNEARPEATYNWPKVCPWQFSFLYLPFASVLLSRAAPRLVLFPRIFPSPASHSTLSLRATNRRNCSALVDMTQGILPRPFPTTPFDSFKKALYSRIDCPT